MGEDSVENLIHGSDVLKGAHRAGASSDFAESAFDSVVLDYLLSDYMRQKLAGAG